MNATLEDHPKAPTCPCCDGEGLHYVQVTAGGRSPFDYDAKCDTCNGTGLSWFTTRANSCRGARSLRGAE